MIKLLGWGFCLRYTAGVVEMITHLAIPALQTGKTEHKEAEGSILMILWILSMPDGHHRARKEKLGLLRPLWSSDSEAHVQMAPLTVSPGPCRTRSCQAGAQLPTAHLLLRCLGNVLLFQT